MYGDKKCEKVNDLRHQKIIRKEKKKKTSSSTNQQSQEQNLVELYKKMKKSNPAALHPCFSTFEQHTFRSNLVTNMWRQASNTKMKMWDITKHGYKVENDRCIVHWYNVNEAPDITYNEPQEHDDPTTDNDSSDESESSDIDSDFSDSDMD